VVDVPVDDETVGEVKFDVESGATKPPPLDENPREGDDDVPAAAFAFEGERDVRVVLITTGLVVVGLVVVDEEAAGLGREVAEDDDPTGLGAVELVSVDTVELRIGVGEDVDPTGLGVVELSSKLSEDVDETVEVDVPATAPDEEAVTVAVAANAVSITTLVCVIVGPGPMKVEIGQDQWAWRRSTTPA
jgi:hypothetical protein